MPSAMDSPWPENRPSFPIHRRHQDFPDIEPAWTSDDLLQKCKSILHLVAGILAVGGGPFKA